MRIINRFTVFFVTLVVMSFTVSAQELTVKIAGAHWQGFVNPDGTGQYLSLIRKALPEHVKIEWEINQFERARKLFMAEKADALIGVYKGTYPDKLYPREPIDMENELRAFFIPEMLTLAKVSDLTGKRLAWRKGYAFESFINDYSGHISFEDTDRIYNLLVKGKIDTVLDYSHNVPDGLRSRLKSIIVLPKQPLWIVFHNSARGRHLLELFERGRGHQHNSHRQ